MIIALVLGAVAVLVAGLSTERSRRRRVELALEACEAARRASDAEAQTLAGRLIVSQESERRRIARDLHDNFSQQLGLLCVHIACLRANVSASAAEAEAMNVLAQGAADIAADVHRLAHDLHPPKLELLGLGPALEGLCRDVSRRYDLQVAFRNRAAGRRLPPDRALCVYRVSQEALQNVVKHSGSSTAIVRLRPIPHGLRLHVADQGSGFAAGVTRQSRPRPAEHARARAGRRRPNRHTIGGRAERDAPRRRPPDGPGMVRNESAIRRQPFGFPLLRGRSMAV